MVWEYYEPPALSPSSRIQSLDLEVQSVLLGVKPLLFSAPAANPATTAGPAFTTKEATFTGTAASEATLGSAAAEAATAAAAASNSSSLLRNGTATDDLANINSTKVGRACECRKGRSPQCRPSPLPRAPTVLTHLSATGAPAAGSSRASRAAAPHAFLLQSRGEPRAGRCAAPASTRAIRHARASPPPPLGAG